MIPQGEKVQRQNTGSLQNDWESFPGKYLQMNKDSLAPNKDDSGESLWHGCVWQEWWGIYTYIFLIYILHILKASACIINEQERGEKRKRREDSVVQSIEGRMLWYQAQHFIKYKGTVAGLFILGILGLILIVCASFIPAYLIES